MSFAVIFNGFLLMVVLLGAATLVYDIARAVVRGIRSLID